MYLKNEDVKFESVENARGGKGTIRKTSFLTKEEMKESSRLFGKIIIPPGCSFGYHVHEKEGEAYHILAGKGMYNDNGTEYEVNAGDTKYTMSGCGHGIENIGDTDLEIIALILLDK